MSRDLAI
jgi:hypothetical protein